MTLRNICAINRLWHLRSEVAWVAAGQVFAFVGGFIAIKFLTTIMGPSGYGYFALGLTIAGAVQMFVFGALGQAVTRFMSISGEMGMQSNYLALVKHANTRAGLTILILSCLASLIVTMAVGAGWGALVEVASLFAIANGWNGNANQFLNTLRMRRAMALHQSADVWIRALAAIIGAYISKWFGVAALAGYLIGAALLCVSLLRTIHNSDFVREYWDERVTWQQVDAKLRQQFLRYAGSFVLGAFPVAINMFSDRWILQTIMGNREVGIYAALYQIANAPIALLVSIINQMAIPIIYERAGSMTTAHQRASSRHALDRVIILVSGLVLLTVLAVYATSDLIVRLLTTNEFATRHDLLVLLVAAIGISWIGNLKTIEAECNKIPHVTLLPKFVAAAMFIILGVAMGNADGARGVAIALMLSSSIYTALVFVVLRIVNRKLE